MTADTVTRCMDCGRELAPVVIPGAWRCGTCVERIRKETTMSDTPAAKGGAAPPPAPNPPEWSEASAPADAGPSRPEQEPPAITGEAILTPPPSAPERVAPRSTALARPAYPRIVERPEPTWRELGWWLSLSESGSQDAQARGGAAALRLYYVTQLGLPLWAVRELSLISGKLVVSARLLRALANRAGLLIERVDSSDEACTAVLVRAGSGEVLGSSTFTIEDARRAGLIRAGSAWQTYPARMLWARASSHVLTDYAPEVVLGMQTEDEAREAYALEAEPIGVDTYTRRGVPYPPDRLEPDGDEDIPF